MVDCFRERVVQANALKCSSLLVLHCVDLSAEVTVSLYDIPCLDLLAYFAHVSFPDKQCQRRVVLLPKLQTTIAALESARSPTLIDVSHSFKLEVCVLRYPLLALRIGFI